MLEPNHVFSADFHSHYDNLSPHAKIILGHQLSELDDGENVYVELSETGDPILNIVDVDMLDTGLGFDFAKVITNFQMESEAGIGGSWEAAFASVKGTKLLIDAKTGEAWQGDIGVAAGEFAVGAGANATGVEATVGVDLAALKAGAEYFKAPSFTYTNDGVVNIEQLSLGLSAELKFGAEFGIRIGSKTGFSLGFFEVALGIDKDNVSDRIDYLNSEKDFLTIKEEAINNSMPREDSIYGHGSMPPEDPSVLEGTRTWYENELIQVKNQIENLNSDIRDEENPDEAIIESIKKQKELLNEAAEAAEAEQGFVLPDSLPKTGASDGDVANIAAELEANIDLLFQNMQKYTSTVNGI